MKPFEKPEEPERESSLAEELGLDKVPLETTPEKEPDIYAPPKPPKPPEISTPTIHIPLP